jgi:hypothetical protein
VSRVAIVGTGAIVECHARDLTLLSDRAQIVAAVDVDAARLDAFAQRWAVPHRFGDLAEMLATHGPTWSTCARPRGAPRLADHRLHRPLRRRDRQGRRHLRTEVATQLRDPQSASVSFALCLEC